MLKEENRNEFRRVDIADNFMEPDFRAFSNLLYYHDKERKNIKILFTPTITTVKYVFYQGCYFIKFILL
jgi:hypothetical protein